MNATQRHREIDTAMSRSILVKRPCPYHLRRSRTGCTNSASQNGGLDVRFEEREIAVGAGEAAVPQGLAGQAEGVHGLAGGPARAEVLIHLVGEGLAHGVRPQGAGELVGVVDLAENAQRLPPADRPVGALAAA